MFASLYESLGVLAEIATVAESVAIAGSIAIPVASASLDASEGQPFNTSDAVQQIVAAVAKGGLLAAVVQAETASPSIGDDVRAVQAALAFLYLVLAVIEALEAMNGWGSPDQGGDFSDGATTFSGDISNILQGAAPIDWSGASAAEYERQNQDQLNRVDLMAHADRRMAHLLAIQAGQVEQGRMALADTRISLIGSIAVVAAIATLAIWALSEAGVNPLLETWALSLEMTMLYMAHAFSLSAALAALGYISDLIAQGEHNHKTIRSARREYISIIDDVAANVPTDAAPITEPTALTSSTFSFSDIANAANRPTTPPEESDAAGEAKDWWDRHVALGALTEPAATPAFTLPPLTDPAGPSRQAASLATQASHPDPVNRTTTMTNRTPAETEKNTGADSGATQTIPVPVDTAATPSAEWPFPPTVQQHRPD